MSTPHRASHVLEAEEAVSRVLEAERIARAGVAASEAEAASLVAEANARAQALRERTAARIEYLSERMTSQAQQRLDRIRAEQERLAAETGADPGTLARLRAAIDKLVLEIAGGESLKERG
jgi:F0F1-type ATP synthase membrane subunit b/b'